MIKKFSILAIGLFAPFLAMLFASGMANAADMPPFFSAGQMYAEKQENCVGPDDAVEFERPMVLTGEGLSAHESGCQFVEFKPVIYSFAEPAAEPDSYLVTAACGDDSGITRPDVFHMHYYDGKLTLTSQNDYMYDLLRQREEGDWESWGFVNLEFEMCQPR